MVLIKSKIYNLAHPNRRNPRTVTAASPDSVLDAHFQAQSPSADWVPATRSAIAANVAETDWSGDGCVKYFFSYNSFYIFYIYLSKNVNK